MNLDLELAYTDWASSCRSPHPTRDDLVCRRSCRHTDDHATGYGAGRVTWTNTEDPRPDWPLVPVVRAS